MNLDFLLSPDKDNNNDASSSANPPRTGRNDTPRSEPSPLSLDYIAPRTSDSSRHNTQSHRQLSRHFGESSSAHLHLPPPHELTSLPPPRTSTSASSAAARDQASSSRFKTKNGKPQTPSSHLRTPSSSEVKPHVCPNCQRSFYKLEQLKRHNRLVHLNLRPFVCHTCDLSFGTKQNMQVHLTTRKHQHRLETLQGHRSSSHGSSSRPNPWNKMFFTMIISWTSKCLTLSDAVSRQVLEFISPWWWLFLFHDGVSLVFNFF